MSSPARVGTLTIANGGTDTPGITTLQYGRAGLGQAKTLTIYAPAALTAAVTVQVLPRGDSTWRTLQQNGADVAVAVGKAVQINSGGWDDLRLHSAGAEGAARDFLIDASIDTLGGLL